MNVKLLFVGAIFAVSCGGSDTVIEKEVPAPTGPTTPGPAPTPPGSNGDSISYAEMQNILNKNCVSCHASADFMQSETLLRRSRVKDELTSRNMPPTGAKPMSEGDRTLGVNFFL